MTQKFLLAGPPADVDRRKQLGIASYLPPAGAKKFPCVSCATETWIGPRQQAARQANGEENCEVLCFGCAKQHPEMRNSPMFSLNGRGGSYTTTDGKVFAPPEERRN